MAAVPGTNRYLGTQYRPTNNDNNNNNNNNNNRQIRGLIDWLIDCGILLSSLCIPDDGPLLPKYFVEFKRKYLLSGESTNNL
jgi:hypothetical protein